MMRVFITGSSDGIGRRAAFVLANEGHEVYLHARNDFRATEALAAVPKAQGVLIGDLDTIAGAKVLAARANNIGTFDAIIHNAGIGPSSLPRITNDGFQALFAVDSLAPYILTSLIHRPKRLLYLSSDAHAGGSGEFNDVTWSDREYSGWQAYCDSKLHNIFLAYAVAKRWPEVQSCAYHPGWIQTKMVPVQVPGRVETPGKVIAAFATGNCSIFSGRSGLYFDSEGLLKPVSIASDRAKHDEFLRICERLSGVPFPT